MTITQEEAKRLITQTKWPAGGFDFQKNTYIAIDKNMPDIAKTIYELARYYLENEPKELSRWEAVSAYFARILTETNLEKKLEIANELVEVVNTHYNENKRANAAYTPSSYHDWTDLHMNYDCRDKLARKYEKEGKIDDKLAVLEGFLVIAEKYFGSENYTPPGSKEKREIPHMGALEYKYLDALKELALTYEKAGNIDKAIGCLRKAADTMDEQGWPHNSVIIALVELAETSEKLGKWEDAKEARERIVEKIDGLDPEARFEHKNHKRFGHIAKLVLLCLKCNDIEKAEEYYREAEGLSSTYEKKKFGIYASDYHPNKALFEEAKEAIASYRENKKAEETVKAETNPVALGTITYSKKDIADMENVLKDMPSKGMQELLDKMKSTRRKEITDRWNARPASKKQTLKN